MADCSKCYVSFQHHVRRTTKRLWCNLDFFLVKRLKRFLNDQKKFSHFGQNVWKCRLKTLLWQVLIQLWDKWPKCLGKKRQECFSEKKAGCNKHTLTKTHNLEIFPCVSTMRSVPTTECNWCINMAMFNIGRIPPMYQEYLLTEAATLLSCTEWWEPNCYFIHD